MLTLQASVTVAKKLASGTCLQQARVGTGPTTHDVLGGPQMSAISPETFDVNEDPSCNPRPSPAQQPSAKRIGEPQLAGEAATDLPLTGGPTPMQLLDIDLTSVPQLVGRAAAGLLLARGPPLVQLAPGGPSSVLQLAGEAAVVPLHSK
ncbi:hypothetical protein QJQ45_018507, partial [Haematococcus lacustris]